MKRSESITNLAKALCAVQSELEPAPKNSNGYNYEYTDLTDIVKAVCPVITRHGLCFSQSPTEFTDSKVGVVTLLMHTSGEWIESTMTLPVSKATAQEIGSAITYAKRYSLSALVGLVYENEDSPKRLKNNTNKTNKQTTEVKKISEGQRKSLFEILKSKGFNSEEMQTFLGTLGYKNSKDIPEDKFDIVFNAAVGLKVNGSEAVKELTATV